MIVKVLLIDDEQNALDYLEMMLNPYSDVQIIGTYRDVDSAFQQLINEEVDVVFLDIELGPVHGIDVAEKLVELYPKLEIVFVTAYHKFAVDAFELNVVDYLLKPVLTKRLEVTIERVRGKLIKNGRQIGQLAKSKEKFYATTFGSFHLFDEKQEIVKWRTKKGKELVALLWRHRDLPVSKKCIIDTLWPNMAYDKAIILLYTTIYQARKALRGQDMINPIKLVGEDYLLQIDISSDFEEFEKIIHAPKNSVTIKRSLELFQDDFLQEYDWARADRNSLRNDYLNYLKTCIFDVEIVIDRPLRQACLDKVYELDSLNEKYVPKSSLGSNTTHYDKNSNE